ncbi:hypothetical protein BHQ21_18520 [Mycobacterium sherrisii]|uniref:SnoaL-like domain-containing protein n=1 Tax=Mycobacterium sherrisii TaxID=243061 RepID=A0A1E3SRW0_9MYCO|nr:nuclear transport factor 2 family protein [Mycobacterium sherrisii]ODR04228.1 hypothetical protein BHQ21_18520 [Mycobacterium sherrisii]
MTVPAQDRAALTDLVHRYAAGVDDRQFDAVAALFTDDAELIVPAPPDILTPVRAHRGRLAIATALAAVAAVTRTEHAIVGEVYDAGPPLSDTLYGRVACVAHHWTQGADGALDVAWHLRYDDEYASTADGWRIRRRALTVHAIETRRVRRLLPPDRG